MPPASSATIPRARLHGPGLRSHRLTPTMPSYQPMMPGFCCLSINSTRSIARRMSSGLISDPVEYLRPARSRNV